MKAARIHRFGPPEEIVIEEVARPAPAAGEVLVRVRAAGVGPWDALVRRGSSVLAQPLPLTLGAELAGAVVAVGDGVRDRAVGDEVFGATNDCFTGAYGEYALAAADKLAARPRAVDHVAAAAIPIVAVTAWQMLFDAAGLKRGQALLVLGAAGNVGGWAVQLARRAGARVVAVAEPRDFAELRRLGADETLEPGAPFERGVGPVDAVLDTVGGELQRRSFAALRAGGALVSAVSRPDARLAETHGVRASFILVRVGGARLAELAALVDAGELSVRVGSVLPLGEAVRAHQMLERRVAHARGKIVLAVAD